MTAMQVRWFGRLVGFALLTASLVHVATVWLLPQLTMNKVFERTGDANGYNILVHAPAVTAESRAVVRPSPDLAYSICAFDLLDGPVRINVPKAADYISVSAYADNTDNFLVVNDTAFEADGWTGWLALEHQAESMTDGNVTVSPSRKGVVLIRRLVRDQADWALIERERGRMSCEGS